MPGVGQSADDGEQVARRQVQTGNPGSTVPDKSTTSPTMATAAGPQGGVVDADTVVDISNTGASEEDVDIYLEPAIEVLAAGASMKYPHFVDIDGTEVCAVGICIDGWVRAEPCVSG